MPSLNKYKIKEIIHIKKQNRSLEPFWCSWTVLNLSLDSFTVLKKFQH